MNHRLYTQRKSIIIFLILLLACSISSWFLTKKNHADIVVAVHEHAQFLSEPLWNYDENTINAFLETVTLRKEYESIRIYADGAMIVEHNNKRVDDANDILKALYIVHTSIIKDKINKDGNTIGEIEISWRDDSGVIIFFTFVFLTLLFIIFLLYFRVSETNNKLKLHVSRLKDAIDEIKEQKNFIELVFNVAPQGLLTIDDGEVSMSNLSFQKMTDNWANHFRKPYYDIQTKLIERLNKEIAVAPSGEYTHIINGESINIKFSVVSLEKLGQDSIKLASFEDVSEFSSLQRRVQQAEKLEAVGQLAAGIAHEINTPTQYVMTNMTFLSDSIKEISEILNNLSKWIKNEDRIEANKLISYLEKELEEIDWEFLAEELPESIKQTNEGLQRIQSIVSAMKKFAHPSGNQRELGDINDAIKTSITVSSNEWKHVARIDLNLDESLVKTPCFIDQINQVILILIVNCSHAIEEHNKESKKDFQGVISIETSQDSEMTYITFTDNGIGMTSEVKDRIFEPFFTTKEVGEGSGQGLSIAYDVITKQHGGEIQVTSSKGEGTTFRICLPLANPK